MPDITMDAPAAAGSDHALESAIDQFVTMPGSSTAGVETEPAEAAPVETTAPLARAEPAQAKEAAQQSATTSEEEQLPADDDEALEKINARAGSGQKEIRVDVNRWKRVYDGGYKQFQAMQAAVPGITPEAARDNYEFASGFQQMQADFRSGTPEGVGRVAEFLTKGIEGAPPESFGILTESLTDTLRETNPGAYAAFESKVLAPAVQDVVQELYAEAKRTGNLMVKWAAQALDYKATGKYRDPAQAVQQTTANDPLAAREADIQRREQAIESNTAAERNAAWSQQFDTVNSNLTGVITKAVDSALKNVASEYEQYPETLKAIRGQVAQGIRQKIDSDPQFVGSLDSNIRAMQAAYNRAWSRGQRLDLSADIGRLVAQYEARASSFAASVAKPIVNEASAKLVKNNEAVHEKRAANEGKRAPVTGGSPVRRSVVPDLSNARTVDEAMDAVFANFSTR